MNKEERDSLEADLAVMLDCDIPDEWRCQCKRCVTVRRVYRAVPGLLAELDGADPGKPAVQP